MSMERWDEDSPADSDSEVLAAEDKAAEILKSGPEHDYRLTLYELAYWLSNDESGGPSIETTVSAVYWLQVLHNIVKTHGLEDAVKALERVEG